MLGLRVRYRRLPWLPVIRDKRAPLSSPGRLTVAAMKRERNPKRQEPSSSPEVVAAKKLNTGRVVRQTKESFGEGERRFSFFFKKKDFGALAHARVRRLCCVRGRRSKTTRRKNFKMSKIKFTIDDAMYGCRTRRADRFHWSSDTILQYSRVDLNSDALVFKCARNKKKYLTIYCRPRLCCINFYGRAFDEHYSSSTRDDY